MIGGDRFRALVLRVSGLILPLSVGVFAVTLTLSLLGSRLLPLYTFLCISLVFGLLLWYAGYILGHKRRFYFAATFLLLTAALLAVMQWGLISLPGRAIWPFLTLFVGISFMVSGHFRFDRIYPSYAVLAVAFTGLGFIFLLFSTDIIPVSLGSAVLWWSPVIFLPLVISVALWMYRRNKTPRP